MTHEQAEAFLQEYRTTMRIWAQAIGGFGDGDIETLQHSIETGRHTLSEIAETFPELSYVAAMLKGSTDKSAEFFIARRPERPPTN